MFVGTVWTICCETAPDTCEHRDFSWVRLRLACCDIRLRSIQVRKYAAEQDAISAEAKALVKRSRQKEAANTKLWEEVHKAAQVGLIALDQRVTSPTGITVALFRELCRLLSIAQLAGAYIASVS